MQIISNYSWAYTSTSTCGADGCPSGTNKYSQHYISTEWTNTDAHGETYVGDLRAGLNSASDEPAGFTYLYGTDLTWATFHDALTVDTWWWHMPLAARVNPRKSGSSYYLASWAGAPGGTYGHWITLRGYSGDSQSSSTAYYNDSSGGVDEHDGTGILGSTGAFSNRSYTVWKTITFDVAGGHYYIIW